MGLSGVGSKHQIVSVVMQSDFFFFHKIRIKMKTNLMVQMEILHFIARLFLMPFHMAENDYISL